MKIVKNFRYIIFLTILVIAGCPNTMIGLGDKVDIDVPSVSIGKYGNGSVIVNGDYVKGEVILTGSASDDIGIQSVKLSFDGGLTFSNATVSSNQLSWSYTVDTSAYADGEKDIIVLVSDTSASPKTSEERLLLYFDNTAPLVEVTVSPGFASPASDSTFSIKGEATDPYRIKSVSVSMTQGSGTLSNVEGTNTWSFVLSNAATGPYKFEITAEDYAGNMNTHFFHYNDINTLNGGSYISIEDLYKIENGETVTGSQITQSSLAGIELTELPLTVDMNDDVPVITISNPEVAAQLGGNALVIGRVEDDDAVDTATLQISVDGGAWEWDSTLPGTEITGSGQAVNFKYDISSLGNGAHSIAVKASDDHSTTKTSDTVNFTIDLGAPQISITSPSQGEYLDIATVSLTGTAYDDQSVSSVKVQLDGEVEASWRDTATSNGFSDWTYTTPALSEGMHTVKVYAEDGTGKVSSYNISFYIDTTFPTVSFNYPVMNSEVYGDVSLLGVCSDNSNAFTSGFIKVGKDGSWTAVTNLNYWSYPLTNLEGTYANTSSSNDLGGGIWQLPVTFKVTDIAGNETITAESDYSFHINASLDKPETVITYPSTGFKSGGPVTVRGTSYDEQQILRVEMRIDLDGHGNFDKQIDLNGSNGTNDLFEDETKWYPVSGTLNWQQDLNTTGELFSVNTGGTGTVTIQVRAVDTKDGFTDGVIGDIQSIDVTFDNSYPYFDNLSHSSYDYAKETFTLTAQAHDSELVQSILISYNGGTSYTDITGSSTLIGAMDGKDYSISQSIDTTAYIPTSGILPLKLKVVDNASNSTDTSINLNVDNILPTGSWTGVLNDITGVAFKVQGEALDSGTVSGIDKVEVYFVRSGNVYNPSLVDTSIVVGTADFGDGNGSVQYPASGSYKITINDLDELGNDGGANGDGDTFNESLTLSGSTYSWWAEFNSGNIPDGILEMHYVVWDKSGNAHHYVENGFIKNNKPSISSITVGTDLDWSGVVDAGKRFTYSGSFNAQNRLYISISANDDDFANLNYSIYHGSDNSGTLLSSTLDLTDDITVAPYSDGSDTFFCEVTDSDGIVTSSLIDVIIDNTDDINPTISIDTLTQGSVILGHIEENGDSLHDGTDPDVSGTIKITGNSWDNQRIKSIKLTLDGIGTDYVVASWVGNALISQELNFNIDTYSFSEDTGLLITWTYTWDSATVTGVAANNVAIGFAIEDYASTPNTASDSLTVDVVPYISRIQTSVTDSFSDVFSRSSSGKYPVRINSTDGTFETIKVYGYNLNPTVTGALSDVRLSLDPDGIAGVTKKGIGLSYTTTDYTQLDVNMQLGDLSAVASGNGYLNIFTNGIPSINNINNNTNNSEADYINPNLADDRYLSLWDLNLLHNTVTTADSAVYPSMAMNGDTPVFAYVNNAAGYGRARYWDGSTDKAIYNNWDLFTYTAVDLNSSGNHAVPYDINVVNGNYGDYNSGNYGGILTSFYYDVPAHNYYPDSRYFQDNHIWLDNLVDTSGTTTAVLDRYQHPDMVVNSSGTTAQTRVFYTVYDRMTDRILFRTYQVGTNSGLTATTGGQINNSGTALYTDLDQNNRNGDFPAYDGNNDNNARFISSNTTGATPSGEHVIDSVNTGEYAAVAATANGSTAVVAYYDATGTGNVRLKYNNTPTNSGTWADLGIIDAGYGGENIDMVIDSTDNIHIAYYDNNNGDLRYIYLPKSTATPTWIAADVQSVIVDSYFDVGEKLTLEIDSNDKPYIAYKGVNRSGKVAWLTGSLAAGSDSSNQFTGAWEIFIVPTQITNTDSNKFCIGVDTNNLPVMGYTNGGIEYIRLLADLLD